MQSRRSVNIWRVDLSEPYAQARKVVSSSREQTAPNISPDGTQIAFQSNRSGSFALELPPIAYRAPTTASAGALRTG